MIVKSYNRSQANLQELFGRYAWLSKKSAGRAFIKENTMDNFYDDAATLIHLLK